MLSRFRPSPALAVACIALAVALGGTSYAAVVLPAGSVGTKQLRDNAVVGGKVKDGTLRARDFRAGELSAGAPGPAGLAGPAGPAGAPGAAGAQGPKGDGATKLFAVVSGSGGVVRSSGGVAVQKLAGSGRYTVSFPQDVSNCVPVVSVSGTGGNPEVGTAAAAPEGSSVSQVTVATSDMDGSASDKTFAVAVFC
jgi:hypothetical protein